MDAIQSSKPKNRMRTLKARVAPSANPSILAFRRSHLHPERRALLFPATKASVHVSIQSQGEVVAYCRLTWGESAPVQNNPLVKCLLEPGADVADLIDGFVIEEFRAIGLYNLLAALAVEAAFNAKKSHLVLSASSAQGLTPVMQTWPILRAGMLGINPYSDAPLDLFLVPITLDRRAINHDLKSDQIEKLRSQAFLVREDWKLSSAPEAGLTEGASRNLAAEPRVIE